MRLSNTRKYILNYRGSILKADRRKFLEAITAGIAGGALVAAPATALAQGSSTEKPRKPTYDVFDFGAKGNGEAIDTAAINHAIQEAAAAGGGTVNLRAGTYRCYSIHLKSNVALFLAPGSTILAAEASAQGIGYDPAESNKPWEDYQDYVTTTGITDCSGVKAWRMFPSSDQA